MDEDYREEKRWRTPQGMLVMKVVVSLVGIALVLGVLYVIFFRPDTYEDLKRSIENRDAYAKEAQQARGEAKALEEKVAQLEAQLADGDSFAQSLQESLRKSEEEKASLAGQVEAMSAEAEEKDEELRSEGERMTAVTAERDDLRLQLDGWEAGLRKRWHLSLGGLVSNPVDSFRPEATALVGIGRGNLLVLGGAGVDWSGEMTVSLGAMWTW